MLNMRMFSVSLALLLLVAVIEARRGGRGPPGTACTADSECPTGETCITLPSPPGREHITVKRCTSPHMVSHACEVNGDTTGRQVCQPADSCTVGPFSRTENGVSVSFKLCERPPRPPHGSGRSRVPPGTPCEVDSGCPTGETCATLPPPPGMDETVKRCTGPRMFADACEVNGDTTGRQVCQPADSCTVGPFSRTYNGVSVSFKLCERPPRHGHRH